MQVPCRFYSAAVNNSDAIPTAAPTTHGKPRTIPAADPVAVIITLLGPGVIAATSEKIRKGMACSSVMGLTGAALTRERVS